jgi:hypothetical protein
VPWVVCIGELGPFLHNDLIQNETIVLGEGCLFDHVIVFWFVTARRNSPISFQWLGMEYDGSSANELGDPRV